MTMQRRFSPRLQNLPNVGNTNIETISNGSDSKKPPNTRASPRLQKIALEKRPYYGCSEKKKPSNASQDKHIGKKHKVDHSSSQCVPDVCDLDNGGNTSFGMIPSENDSKNLPKTRASPRLQKIPLEKRPYNGCIWKKKPSNASQNKLMVKRLKVDHSMPECVPDVYDLDNGDNTSFETISSESDSEKPPKTQASPRLQKIPLEKRPYYGCSLKKKPSNASQDKPMDKKLKVDHSMPQCVPDVYDLDNGGNTSFETISSESDSKKPPKTRASPRLQKIPSKKIPYYGRSLKKKPSNASQDKPMDKKLKVDHSMLECVPDVYDLDNGGNTSFETISSESDSKKPPKTRASPRLQKIPLEKRPYYGCSWKKKPSNASQDMPMGKKLKVHHSMSECVPDVYDLDNGSSTSFETISSESDSKQPPKTRASPRLQKIPLEKRPYYGCSWKKRPSNSSQDKPMVKKLKVDHSMSECLPNAYDLDGSGNTGFETISSVSDSKKPPKTRASTRLQKVPLENRPYYGCSLKKRPLNASQDNLMVKEHTVDHSTFECLPNAYDLDSSGNTGFETISSESDSKKLPKTRASPRLQKVPLEKRPYYGCSLKKRPMNASQDNLMVKEHTVDLSTSECVSDINYDNKEEEKRCDRLKDSDAEITNGKMTDKQKACEDRIKQSKHKGDFKLSKHTGCVKLSKHPDLKTIYGMLKKNEVLCHERYSGDLPGIRVGHHFYSRAEIVAVGLHKLLSKGIDNLGEPYLKSVIEYLDEEGVSGFKVFNYRLKRLPREDKLTSQNQVNFVRGKLSRLHLESTGRVCKDLSDGQEDKCIPVLNLYNPPVVPKGFKYIKSIQVAKNVSIPPNAPGCSCRGKCTNPKSCLCAQLNGGDFPYVSQDGGRLLEAKDIVFECGPNCGCGPQCVNRTSQLGLKYHLEVYCTKDKGWAVRSWDFIPSGAPICEYIGVLRKNNELDNISENDYIFEIDCLHTMKGIGGRERRLGDVSLPASNLVSEVEETLESDAEPDFCIDASSFGNVARFINHSCDPNLFVQCILSSHRDVRLARIVLFAADDIPPMQELTYDYNYAIDSVIGPNGKTKQLPCHCGTADCRKRLY